MSIKETIIGITNSLAVAAMEGYEYSNWSNDFRAEQINERVDRMKSTYKLNLLELTEQDCKDLLFHTWDIEETDTTIYLIPLYLLQFIDPDYVNFTCIDGSIVTRKSELDNDHRYGALAYGLTFQNQIDNLAKIIATLKDDKNKEFIRLSSIIAEQKEAILTLRSEYEMLRDKVNDLEITKAVSKNTHSFKEFGYNFNISQPSCNF